MQSKIIRVIQRFDFRGLSGLLQYWVGSAVQDTMVLTVAGQPSRFNYKTQGLEKYRERCIQDNIFVGPYTQVDQESFAGLAAQARISDQRTVQARDQFMGQLVMPVFSNTGDHEIFLGVIEFVTTFPNESYLDYFNQIHNLLTDENLATKPMAKMIKVEYRDYLIKFPLPLTFGITYLWGEVTRRLGNVNQVFTTLDIRNQTAFRIMYEDCNGNNFQILSDDDLGDCIANSSLNGMMTIRMSIKE